MKHIFLVATTLLFATLSCFGQHGGGGGRGMERIHAAKMAYITDRLKLTTEQSSNFIPLYNEYEQEKKESRKKYLQKYKGIEPSEADDATSKQFIDDNLDYQQDVIGIKRKYNDQFLKIISPTQLADMYKAEREFKQLLMKRLEQKRNGGGGRGLGRSGY